MYATFASSCVRVLLRARMHTCNTCVVLTVQVEVCTQVPEGVQLRTLTWMLTCQCEIVRVPVQARATTNTNARRGSTAQLVNLWYGTADAFHLP